MKHFLYVRHFFFLFVSIQIYTFIELFEKLFAVIVATVD